MSGYFVRPMRPQVTLRNILISTFWWALWCGALVADPKFKGSDTLWIFCIIPFRFAGPCVAIGALFGRTWVGALVGLAVVACLAIAIYIHIMLFLDHL